MAGGPPAVIFTICASRSSSSAAASLPPPARRSAVLAVGDGLLRRLCRRLTVLVVAGHRRGVLESQERRMARARPSAARWSSSRSRTSRQDHAAGSICHPNRCTIVERRRGRIASLTFPDLRYALFLPCRIAGPIRRFLEFTAAVRGRRCRRRTSTRARCACWWGWPRSCSSPTCSR